jgi:hypothetical protein
MVSVKTPERFFFRAFPFSERIIGEKGLVTVAYPGGCEGGRTPRNSKNEKIFLIVLPYIFAKFLGLKLDSTLAPPPPKFDPRYATD